MNLALWRKSLSDIRWLLVWLSLLVFVFSGLYVWLSSMIELPKFGMLLNLVPAQWERLSGVPFKDVATPAGRIALAYVHPVILFTLVVWAIARGSDIVAGELDRGTMEIMLAQPIRRTSVYAAQAVMTSAGSLVLAVATWLGTMVGIRLVGLADEVSHAVFIPAAANLFGLAFFLSGVTSLVSSWSRYRSTVIGIGGGIFIVALILKLIGRMAPGWEWLLWTSFLTPFEPQALVSDPDAAYSLLAQYNGVLIGLGLLGYIAGCIVFCRRDLPAPV